MKLLSRIFILFVLLGAAIVCYSIGSTGGIGLFLILGVLFEGAFWFGLFGRRKHRARG